MLIKRYPIFVLLLVTLILQLITACSPSAQDMQGERWVVFPAEQAKELGLGDWLLSGGETVEYWTPSEKDILALENGLAPYLQDNPGRFDTQGTPVWERLDDYDRQYIGIILDGKMIVYANYFCNSTETNWREDFILVLDGGECYFQFKHDADSGEFFDLQVNGDA